MLESSSSLCYDVTFCSVSYYSAEYLKLNKQLLSHSDPDNIFQWLVVSNDREEDIPGFNVIMGDEPPEKVPEGYVSLASYHHAMGLNKLIPHIKTRFVCFIDPDFFIFKPICNIISDMIKNRYAFYGSPYYPSNKQKIYNFPVAFCMFVDRDKIDISDFDFMPEPGLEKEGIIADTGYKIYKKYQYYPHWSSIPYNPSVIPGINTTTYNITNMGINISSPIDQYFDENNKLFGLHCHMKLHLRKQNKHDFNKRCFDQLTQVKLIRNKVK